MSQQSYVSVDSGQWTVDSGQKEKTGRRGDMEMGSHGKGERARRHSLRCALNCENISNYPKNINTKLVHLLLGVTSEGYMERRTTAWFSQNLNMEMPLVAYGHAGPTLLMLPTAAADYLEYERFHLVDAIRPHIESGRIRAYSINSVNRYSLLNEQMPPKLKAELLTRFDRYIVDEVLPLIRRDTGREDAKPLTTGASLGAFLAANAYFKHPDQFRGVIAMSGSYDVRPYLKDFYDDNVYFNNPADYLPNLNDDYHLPLLQKADAIFIMSGQGAYEAPERSRHLSDILHSKQIPHTLDLWGADVNHDWPWWRRMLPYALDKVV